MPLFVWRNPNSPYQLYFTGIRNDPNAPAGYVLVGSDGSFRRDQQNYMPGAASGGFPAYAPPGNPVDTPANIKATLQAINGTPPGTGASVY